MIRCITFSFLIGLCSNYIGQRINFNTQKNWSLNKKELLLNVGATQFLGDLGGSNPGGYDYSLRDWDWESIGFNVGVGYRYRFHPMFATTSMLSYVMVRGDDAHSEEFVRKARNLHFKSSMFELQQRLEVILFSVEKFSPTYNLPGQRGGKRRNQQYYIFGGVGLTYFNPKAQYTDGRWYALRPLMTEGQDKPYSPLAFTLPMGFGFRVGLGAEWRIGLEASYNTVFSDYLDDVSGVCGDPASYSNDPIAAYFVNPSDPAITIQVPSGSVGGYNWFGPGYQRGDDKQRDSYYRLNLVLVKNITYKDYGRQRIKTSKTKVNGTKIR
ncbi:MAG: hypothetical protein FJZ80_02940 [Bacteroidetes bacterium]|nr:hypothetical protein [Bacteroidota bacterium]MBM3424444.1 hypothetical protein [Bacteroidota bacterium]